MSAIDMMSLLSEVGPHMLRLYPSMPFKVVQAICYAIAGKGWVASWVLVKGLQVSRLRVGCIGGAGKGSTGEQALGLHQGCW